MDHELPKNWVGGVCIRDGKILLIHRINKERLFVHEYFVFPGKDVDEDESLEDALAASFKEISINVQLLEILYTKGEEGDEQEFYYQCKHLLGELPSTTVETNEKGEETQYFTPMWIGLHELDELIVYPEEVKNLLLENSSGAAE